MLNLGSALLHVPLHERVMRECQRVVVELWEGSRRGTPATELTDQEKVALAVTRGAGWRIDTFERRILVTDLVGIADRPGGGYIVAIQRPQPGDTISMKIGSRT